MRTDASIWYRAYVDYLKVFVRCITLWLPFSHASARTLSEKKILEAFSEYNRQTRIINKRDNLGGGRLHTGQKSC